MKLFLYFNSQEINMDFLEGLLLIQSLKATSHACLGKTCNWCSYLFHLLAHWLLIYFIHFKLASMMVKITKVLVFKEFYRGAEHTESTETTWAKRLVYFLNATTLTSERYIQYQEVHNLRFVQGKNIFLYLFISMKKTK